MTEDFIKKLRKKVEDEALMNDALAIGRERRRDPGARQERPYSYKQPIPDDLWIQCPECKAIMYREDFDRKHSVCQHCGHHFRIAAWERIRLIADPGSFEEFDRSLQAMNPLEYEGYPEKIASLGEKTGLRDAIVSGVARIGGFRCCLAAMDSRFMMGSMGSVVGEKITRLFDYALSEKLPLLLFSVSGGARMQEGIISLMQMAKTSAAVKRHSDAGLLFLSFMTDPTTGGVTASFASLGDLILSEPGTIIGFAGRRVIEGTISETLPDDFQRAEFLLEHGFLDRIVPRGESRDLIIQLLRMHVADKAEELDGEAAEDENYPYVEPVRRSGSACLEIIRQKGRPTILDYLPLIFDEAVELHGDRYYGDDPAVWGGLARINGEAVTVIATKKGRDLTENNDSHFGMPHPEGYRKALRLMKQAEKFGRPILTFVDTPGAYCGVEDEERGQGEAIARNLLEMSTLSVPIISCVIGEGGSGGALAVAVSDRLGMLSNAIYSVISPRGFASLLWKDPSRENEAADVSHITAFDLKAFGLLDEIIPEPGDGAHGHLAETAAAIKQFFVKELNEMKQVSVDQMLQERQAHYRQIGFYTEQITGENSSERRKRDGV